VFPYSVYGLDLASDTPLPELESRGALPGETPTQITVRLRVARQRRLGAAHWVSRSMLPNGDAWVLLGKIEGGYLLRYRGFADFIVGCSGHEIQCAWIESETTPQTLRHLLLDQVLPLVLNLLGCDVLHATAVNIPAGVCAFIGPAGAGKSTFAASFAAVGYQTFCDDCLVLRRNGEILCIPGYPGVRLWRDSVAALCSHRAKLDEVAGYTSKCRVLSYSARFPDAPRPLIAIYRISRPADAEVPLTTARIEPLTGRAAFMELVPSSYLLDVTEPATLSRHFRCIEQLVTEVPIARLQLPTDFAALPAARRAILDHLAHARTPEQI
jgi:hypothetical protein